MMNRVPLRLLPDSAAEHEPICAEALELVAASLATLPAAELDAVVDRLVIRAVDHPRSKAVLTFLLTEIEGQRREIAGPRH